MARRSVQRLVASIGEGQLLTPPQWEELHSRMGRRFDEPADLAKEMINRGWLTPFQADQILEGRERELVLGPYLLLDLLGQGGMGRVYRARHTLMNRGSWP